MAKRPDGILLVVICLFGMVCYGMALYGMVVICLLGMVWFDMVWYGGHLLTKEMPGQSNGAHKILNCCRQNIFSTEMSVNIFTADS